MIQASHETEFSRNTTTQAINSIYHSLNKRLGEYNDYSNEEREQLADSLLNIHGISRNNFNIINSVERLLQNNLNHESIDENSNKNDKTTKGILKESETPFDKIIGYRYLYRKLKDIYGKQEATRLSGLMYDYSIALSDSTNILIPYCWSFNASVLVTDGKPFKPLKSKPAKRVDSYISILNEVIHQMSNHLAGAIAIGTFFMDIARLMIINENIALETLRTDEATRKYIENQFQRFVHGVNSLSRSGGQESPFTNVSIFDRTKLSKLVEEYLWYFEVFDEKDQAKIDYVLDYIIELQFLYMDFFSKGDPCLDGMPYRFPVSTINLAKKFDESEKKFKITDKEFVKLICEKDIYRYNIFASEGSKIASCCFYGDEFVNVLDENNKLLRITLKEFVENENNKRQGLIYNNWRITSLNIETMELEESKIIGTLKKKNEFSILIEIKVNNNIIKVTPDHIFAAKNKNTGKIEEVTALFLKDNFNNYLLPIEK